MTIWYLILKLQITFNTPSRLKLRALRFVLMLSSPDCIIPYDKMILSTVKTLYVNASPTFIARPTYLRGSSLQWGNIASTL